MFKCIYIFILFFIIFLPFLFLSFLFLFSIFSFLFFLFSLPSLSFPFMFHFHALFFFSFLINLFPIPLSHPPLLSSCPFPLTLLSFPFPIFFSFPLFLVLETGKRGLFPGCVVPGRTQHPICLSWKNTHPGTKHKYTLTLSFSIPLSFFCLVTIFLLFSDYLSF